MYSNERGSRFNFLDLFVKIIFAAIFIFILVWLFPKVPNMTPFYSNVFRENIKYMQEAGESYFTTDKLPTEVGQTNKITLYDMFDKKLVLPFVDKDGNSCNQYDSYVSVTKTIDGYDLKTNLVCNGETDYTIKILGCHDYCESDNCNKTCSSTSITQYQFKKLVSKSSTSYTCPSGYTRSGKYCTKSSLVDTKSAEVVTSNTKTDVKDATIVYVGGTKKLVSTIVTKNSDSSVKVYVGALSNVVSGGTSTTQQAYSCTKTKTVSQPYSCTKTKTVRQSYDCTKSKTEKKCTTTYVSQAYSCNCTSSVDSTGKTVTKCNTCYKSVPKETCSSVSVPYTDTCYRDVTQNYTDTCYKNVTQTYTDTCYRDVTVTNPGSTTYYCPSYATGSEGSGSNLKCYYYSSVSNGYSYSCPTNSNYHTGSGSNLKCYVATNGSSYYKCNDSSYTLKGSKCYKTVVSSSTEYKCDSGYKLDGKVCKKYSTTKIKATAKKTSSTYYSYKWSESSSLSGWTKTGKTRVIAGEENCE